MCGTKLRFSAVKKPKDLRMDVRFWRKADVSVGDIMRRIRTSPPRPNEKWFWSGGAKRNRCPLMAHSGHSRFALHCPLSQTQRKRQRLEIFNRLRSPTHVLAKSASACLAAAVLPRALYN